jgi:serine/threonine protein kinase
MRWFLASLAEGPLSRVSHAAFNDAHAVLLTKDYVPKLCDFGLSKLRGATVASVNSKAVIGESGGAVGTMAYMAPELLDFEVDASEETDMYSFGVVLVRGRVM